MHATKQEYDVSPRTRTVYTKINELYHHADKNLGWHFKSEGVGINHEIIMVTLANRFRLSIMCNNKQYKFSYEMVKKALNELKTDFILKDGTPLNILPISWSYSAENSIDRFI